MTTVDLVQFIFMLAICGAILVDDLVQKRRVKVIIKQLENIRDKIPKAMDPDKFADEVAAALNKLIERGLPSEKATGEKERKRTAPG